MIHASESEHVPGEPRVSGRRHAGQVAESKASRGSRRATAALLRVGGELRDARLAAGLTLRTTSARVGISPSELSRIERGRAPWVAVTTLVRLAAVVGLDLTVRAYPGGDAVRDAGHARLEAAFRELLGAPLGVATEVPIGDPGDQRAWDMVLSGSDRRRAAVELDTRLTDSQGYLRRIALKRRDGGIERLIVVLADTRSNRAAVAATRSAFEDVFAIEDAGARRALAEGRIPDRDALLFVRVAPRHRVVLPSGGNKRRQ